MMRRYRTVIVIIVGASLLSACLGCIVWLHALYRSVEFDPLLLTRGSSHARGTIILDRKGRELRFLPDEQGERSRWVSIEEIPDVVKSALIASEDRRFYRHCGFDATAIMRAVGTNIRNRRIVSGASTISQQVVKLLYPGERERSYRGKLTEILRSIKLEREFAKDRILEYYLNRVPMGNNLLGVEAAARAYFGKSCNNLNAAEAALLASLPKAPGNLDPYGHNTEALLARRDWILERMKRLGFISPAEYLLAQKSALVFRDLSFDMRAPHVVDFLLAKGYRGRVVKTTVDLDLQNDVQNILSSHADRIRIRGANQAAAIVLDNRTMQVLAMAGSLSYSFRDGGFNNFALARHSAGSTLKPFLYGLALESGFTAASLIEDTERKYRSPKGQYVPSNFDRREYGPVTMRSALGNSLNISAVKMLEGVGVEPLYDLFLRMDLLKRQGSHEDYGLGLAVGNPEVTLERLASAYAMLANGGVLKTVNYVLEKDSPDRGKDKGTRIFFPQVAYIITNMLSDPTARFLTFGYRRSMDFPFPVALKTGTSTFYRDLWAVGYTPEYTVAVWIGNADGSPTKKLTGSTGAVPVFADIMNQLYRNSAPSSFQRPEGVRQVRVCGYSGMKPSSFCTHTVTEFFITGTEPETTCTFHSAGEEHHVLSSHYAGWLYTKRRANAEGRYVLGGFGNDLSNVFDDPWENTPSPYKEPVVRIRNENHSVVRSDSQIVPKDPEQKEMLHFTIGEVGIPGFPLLSAGGSDKTVSILYPIDRDIFVIDRYAETQYIQLQAVVDEPAPFIDWFINGAFYRRSGPPYQATWQLERGVFQITAVDPSSRGNSVRIRVE